MRNRFYTVKTGLPLLVTTGFFIISTPPHAGAQLIDNYLPPPALTYSADYLRSGSGAGAQPESENAAATARGVTVASRSHPEYDSQGVQLGSVRVDASGSQSFGFDSNPQGARNPRGDAAIETQAAVNAATNWRRNGLNARVTVDNLEYPSTANESHTDWSAAFGGYLDIGEDRAAFSYTHLNLNVLPTGIDNLGQSAGVNRAIPYRVDEFRGSYTANFGRFSVTPDVEYALYNSDRSGGAFGLNTSDNEQINSRNVVSGGVLLRYELAAGRNLVAVLRGSAAHFTESNLGFPNRNYTDGQALFGVDIDASGSFRYRALIGYDHRSYENSMFGSPSEPIAELQAIWTPTQMTTITGTAARRIEDAVNDTYTPFVFTTGRLQIDHELKRNLILSGYGELQFGDYKSPSYSETIYQAGLSATYRVNRNVAVVASYDFTKDTSSSLRRYNRNIVLLQLKFSL